MLREIRPLDGVTRPRRAVVYDFESAPFPTKPVIPFTRSVHDRITIEIMRGCVQGCRFCQAGYEKRPQRFRSKEKVLEIALESYENTGFDEIGLTSLSSSDHPDLPGMMDALSAAFEGKQVNLSLPSLRVNEQVLELPKRIKNVRKSGAHLAPRSPPTGSGGSSTRISRIRISTTAPPRRGGRVGRRSSSTS